MGERASATHESAVASPSQVVGPTVDEAVDQREAPRTSTDSAASERFSIGEETEDSLAVTLIDEKQMRAGESVTLRIQVTKRADGERHPAAKVNITVKVLGSAFQPSSTYSTTDSAGRSAISITLPCFKAGRAAVLIRAEADGEVAEVRRIIHPA